MSAKAPSSLQFNGISWEIFDLGEHVLLLQAPTTISIDLIHSSTRLIRKILDEKLSDIVPAYTSISLFYQNSREEIISLLKNSSLEEKGKSTQLDKIQIPICYELGLDLAEIAATAGKKEEEVIELHLNGTYKSVFIGFTPGFIYIDGLDASLACPRKANPRKHLAAGSVGIGGEQTGIYSLPSPGGWNILGRTPFQIFDPNKQPPLAFEVGSEITFYQISKNEFEAWGN